MKERFFLRFTLIILTFFLAGCTPVSDDVYYSAMKAAGVDAPETVFSDISDDSPPDFDPSAPIENSNNTLSPDNLDNSPTVSDTLNNDDFLDNAEITNSPEITTLTETTTPAPMNAEPLYTDSMVINAPYGLCYNLTDNIFLYGKNIDEKMYPASITKLLTALVALEHTPDGFSFDIGNEIYDVMPGSSVALLKQGQKLGINAILTALLVPSGNDAALSIAVDVAKSHSALYSENSSLETNTDFINYFVMLMNEYTKSIGLQNSHFSNPDGYHHDNHFSTLRDLLKICAVSAENPIILSICSDPSPTVKFESGESASWTGHLPLLGSEEWGVMGLKTGFTDESMYSFASLAEFDGKHYITIVSGCETSEMRNSDTKKLLTLARDGYEDGTVAAYLEDDFG